jgi:hypothetical protein
MDTLDQAVVTVASWPTPTVAEAGKISNQPNYGQVGLSNHPAIQGEMTREKQLKSRAWPTATVSDSLGSRKHGYMNDGKDRAAINPRREVLTVNAGTTLLDAVLEHGLVAQENSSMSGNHQESWATPRTGMARGNEFTYDRGRGNIEEQAGASIAGGGKLNPRWVETLMGLPIGWTMPSCSQPVTIELTNFDSSGTESSQQRQNLPSKSSSSD